MATNGKNSKNVVARDEHGRWLKGFSGGPGRPLGSRNKLSEDRGHPFHQMRET
jgi:hypothetical protein